MASLTQRTAANLNNRRGNGTPWAVNLVSVLDAVLHLFYAPLLLILPNLRSLLKMGLWLRRINVRAPSMNSNPFAFMLRMLCGIK